MPGKIKWVNKRYQMEDILDGHNHPQKQLYAAEMLF
tara:strand:+ start:442 stop:549 length:108 start_codon:yes stop_codon:yes gene_type:complete